MSVSLVVPRESGQTLEGRRLVQQHAFSYAPAVMPADVLEVDFDATAIDADGLYVIAYPGANGRSPWGGVRRFCRTPVKGLQIFEGDEWRPISDGHRDMRVIGRILNVYRRTNG